MLLTNFKMKNRKIQEERMKGYFVQATKEILKAEGIGSLSVRNIADKAGYSYATLYNYFKDVNDLIFECVNDFQQECNDFVQSKNTNLKGGLIKLKSSIQVYISYFVEYPGIFELFYLNKMSDFGNKKSTINLIEKSLELALEKEWNYCLANRILTAQDIETLKALLKFNVPGILLLYLNRRIPESYTEFISNTESQIHLLLQRYTN